MTAFEEFLQHNTLEVDGIHYMVSSVAGPSDYHRVNLFSLKEDFCPCEKNEKCTMSDDAMVWRPGFEINFDVFLTDDKWVCRKCDMSIRRCKCEAGLDKEPIGYL